MILALDFYNQIKIVDWPESFEELKEISRELFSMNQELINKCIFTWIDERNKIRFLLNSYEYRNVIDYYNYKDIYPYTDMIAIQIHITDDDFIIGDENIFEDVNRNKENNYIEGKVKINNIEEKIEKGIKDIIQNNKGKEGVKEEVSKIDYIPKNNEKEDEIDSDENEDLYYEIQNNKKKDTSEDEEKIKMNENDEIEKITEVTSERK